MKAHDYRLPFEPQLLPAFLAVADKGGVSQAARGLYLSQPAVTAQVRRLEAQLGVALFYRRPRGMALTEAGRRLRETAERLQASLADAARSLCASPEPEGLLVVWASTTIASYVLPPLLAGFAAEHPRVRLRLAVGNTNEVLERVRSHEAHLGLVEGLGRASGLRLRTFVQDELVAVCDPSFMPRSRGLAALRERPILWRERGSGTRAVVERAMRQSKFSAQGHPRFEFASTEAIKEAAIAGLGIAFLSRWSMQRELALGLLRPVPGRGLLARREFRWAFAAGGLSGLARRFYDWTSLRPPAPAA